jgi:hypothetical protein
VRSSHWSLATMIAAQIAPAGSPAWSQPDQPIIAAHALHWWQRRQHSAGLARRSRNIAAIISAVPGQHSWGQQPGCQRSEPAGCMCCAALIIAHLMHGRCTLHLFPSIRYRCTWGRCCWAPVCGCAVLQPRNTCRACMVQL